MPIMIFVTGGTFDKEYNEIDGTLMFKDTHVQEMLRLGRSKVEVEVKKLMLIDSLDMTDEHRQTILKECRNAPHERIVITHGTDTMEQTARVLGQAGIQKTIVLMGAMIPYAFGTSDGLFNLGAALAFAETLPPGVYIAMNGRQFVWNNCRKNRATGQFEEIDPA